MDMLSSSRAKASSEIIETLRSHNHKQVLCPELEALIDNPTFGLRRDMRPEEDYLSDQENQDMEQSQVFEQTIKNEPSSRSKPSNGHKDHLGTLFSDENQARADKLGNWL